MVTIKRNELTEKLGNFVSVQNTESRNGYNYAPNQFEIRFEHGTVFQSYRTMIAVRMNGQLYFTDSHDCSNTTSRHCKSWCGYSAKERREGLQSGKFILIED